MDLLDLAEVRRSAEALLKSGSMSKDAFREVERRLTLSHTLRIPRMTDVERETVTRLRLMLTQARDRLECHRDPMVGEIDRALDDMTKQPARMTTPQFVERMTHTEAIISRIEREREG